MTVYSSSLASLLRFVLGDTDVEVKDFLCFTRAAAAAVVVLLLPN